MAGSLQRLQIGPYDSLHAAGSGRAQEVGRCDLALSDPCTQGLDRKLDTKAIASFYPSRGQGP